MLDNHNSDLYAAFRFAADIQPEPRRWLWPARIPLGKLTLLIGDPAVGKSLLVADLAARVSAGLPWPYHADSPSARTGRETDEAKSRLPEHRFPQGVVLVCPEDGAPDTLRPRLAAARADLSRVCILEGVSQTFRSSLPGKAASVNGQASVLPFMLPAHADVLEQAIRAVDHARLVVLDPLHAVLSPDGQARAEGIVARLGETAARHGVAIVAVGHLAKRRSHSVLYRVRGSLALIAGARAVHLLAADPDDPQRRLLAPLKTVYGPPPPPLAFRITPAPRLDWTDPLVREPLPLVREPLPLVRESLLAPTQAGIPSSPQPLCGTPAPGCLCNLPSDLLDLSPDACSALSEACDWLSDYLATGPRPARDILRDARDAALTTATLRRAKRVLAVRSLKPDVKSPWLWAPVQRPDNEGAQLGGAHA